MGPILNCYGGMTLWNVAFMGLRQSTQNGRKQFPKSFSVNVQCCTVGDQLIRPYVFPHVWQVTYVLDFCKMNCLPFYKAFLSKYDYKCTASMTGHPNISLGTSLIMWMSNSLIEGSAVAVRKNAHRGHRVSVRYTCVCGVALRI